VTALRKGDLPEPQHAALRRITALVAAGAPAGELFDAVVREIVDVLGLSRGWLFRYEAGPAMSVLASVNYPPFPVGSRWPLDGTSLDALARAAAGAWTKAGPTVLEVPIVAETPPLL